MIQKLKKANRFSGSPFFMYSIKSNGHKPELRKLVAGNNPTEDFRLFGLGLKLHTVVFIR